MNLCWITFDDVVNKNVNFPIVGRNALTKELAPNKQKTERWVEDVTTCLDGKFGFKAIAPSIFDSLKIPPGTEDSKGFLDVYVPSIEEFDKTWVPEIDDKGDVVVRAIG